MLKTTTSFIVPFALMARIASAAPGDLDPGFGSGGSVVISESSRAASAVIVLPDGRLVVGGTNNLDAPPIQGFSLVGLQANGAIDASFGSGGFAGATFGGSIGSATALLRQPDGMIVQAGTITGFGSDPVMAVARYQADGDVDATFGTGGLTFVDFPGSTLDQAMAVGRQSDGKLVVAGYTRHSPTDDFFALARLDTDGTLDTTFGTGGLVEAIIPGHPGCQGYALLVLPDDRLIVAGKQGGQGVLVRFDANGAFDPTFGVDGAARGSGYEFRALARQPDGALIAVGTKFFVARPGVTFDSPNLSRFDAHGAPAGGADLFFFFLPRNISDHISGTAVVVGADDTIVIGGTAEGTTPAQRRFVLVRFDSALGLDASFGQGGFVVGPNGGVAGLVSQPDAKLVAVGSRVSTDGSSAALVARYFGGVCGDGATAAEETCDDGNLTSGDGCDANCHSTGCGSGVVTAGEDCDDGNLADGDCCSATCGFEAVGSACGDDGNLCSNELCDGVGTCTHPFAPAPTCHAPIASGKASIQATTGSANRKLNWKWNKGDATSPSELGDPTTTTAYGICVYDYTAGVPHLVLGANVAGGALCAGQPCWRPTSRGFAYKDKYDLHAGFSAMKLTASVAGKSQMAVQIRHAVFPSPPLPLDQDPNVVVQLRNSIGGCWGASFSAAKRNDAAKFSAKSD